MKHRKLKQSPIRLQARGIIILRLCLLQKTVRSGLPLRTGQRRCLLNLSHGSPNAYKAAPHPLILDDYKLHGARPFNTVHCRLSRRMFGPLIHALSRRGLDNTFLPSTVLVPPSSGSHGCAFRDLVEHVLSLTDAILATSSDRKQSGQHKPLPPLPILLRDRIIFTLSGMEAEAVRLGKIIELNHFRDARRDPRARSGEELAVWRSEAYTRWNMLLAEMKAEAEDFRTAERRKVGSHM